MQKDEIINTLNDHENRIERLEDQNEKQYSMLEKIDEKTDGLSEKLDKKINTLLYAIGGGMFALILMMLGILLRNG